MVICLRIAIPEASQLLRCNDFLYQLPIDAFIKTAYDINWINHHTAIEDLDQLRANLYPNIPNIPEEGEDLHQLYFRAHKEEC